MRKLLSKLTVAVSLMLPVAVQAQGSPPTTVVPNLTYDSQTNALGGTAGFGAGIGGFNGTNTSIDLPGGWLYRNGTWKQGASFYGHIFWNNTYTPSNLAPTLMMVSAERQTWWYNASGQVINTDNQESMDVELTNLSEGTVSSGNMVSFSGLPTPSQLANGVEKSVTFNGNILPLDRNLEVISKIYDDITQRWYFVNKPESAKSYRVIFKVRIRAANGATQLIDKTFLYGWKAEALPESAPGGGA